MNEEKVLQEIIIKRSNSINNGIFFIEQNSEKFYSYNKLYKISLNVLSKMKKYGVKEKDEIVFQITDNKKFIILLWACFLGGYIPVPIPIKENIESANNLIKIISILNHPYIVSDCNILQLIRSQTSNIDLQDMKKYILDIDKIDFDTDGEEQDIYIASPSDIALIQFSSGTTRDPKGIVLTHNNIYSNVNSIIKRSKFKMDDKFLSWMPLTHDMGLIGFHLLPLINNNNHILMNFKIFSQEPCKWLRLLSKYKINVTCTPNYGLKHVLNNFSEKELENIDLTNLKIIFNGGEIIDFNLCKKFIKHMKKFKLNQNVFYPSYGLAEGTLAVSIPIPGEELKLESLSFSNKEDSRKFVSLGVPLDCVNVRIVDDENNILDENMLGNIQIKGYSVTQGYYRDLNSTKEILTIDKWIDTGDLGFISKKRLIVTGRKKDVIFFNGQNYYLSDIEKICKKILDIDSNNIVVDSIFNSDNQIYEIIIFVLYNNTNINEFIYYSLKLKRYINMNLGLQIKDIVPITEIPKTVSGKVSKYILINQYITGKYSYILKKIKEKMNVIIKDSKVDKIYPYIEDKLLDIWKEVFKNENININSDFFSLGGNSLISSVIVAKINDSFNVNLNLIQLFKTPTIIELQQFLGDMIFENEIYYLLKRDDEI